MGVKQSVEIERLLQWAYQDELAKRDISSAEGIWDAIAEYGQRGGIDPGHGAAQRYPHFGLPHPDALGIEKAVAKLPDGEIDWASEAEAIMGDLLALADPRPPRARRVGKPTTVGWWEGRRWHAGIADHKPQRWRAEDVKPNRDVILVKSLRTAALVTMHAKLGTRPDWHSEPPRPVPVLGDRGRPVLVGECRAKNVYSEGSHCPLRYEPSPISIAEARADYIAWHRGVTALAQGLELEAHVILPPAAPELPWCQPEAVRQLFSRDDGKTAVRPLPLKPRRETSRAPLRVMPDVPRARG